MKLFLKIGKLLAVLILTVSIVLVSASLLLKDKVGFIILKSLNKNLSTKLDVGSYKLSFLKKFPKASLELKNVLVHSSAGFDRTQFIGINTDTLLAARLVSMEFKLTDILKGIYTIERISAREGNANFFTDSTGHVNYNISIKNNKPGKGETLIELNRINLADMDGCYNSISAHLIIKGAIKSGRLKSRISGGNIDFTAIADMKINSFDLYKFRIDKPIAAKIDLALLSSKTGIAFRKGTLHIDNYDLGINGFVYTDNILDLKLTGHNLDIANLRKYLPDKYLRLIADYDPSGTIVASSTIKGQLSRKSNPHVEINWQLRNGKIDYKKSNLTFKNISFTGYLSNGSKNNYETSIVSLKDFKARFGSSDYTGAITLKSFNKPLVDLSLKGRVFPAELKEFFNLHDISKAEGSVDLDMKIINRPWPKNSFSLNSIVDLKPEGVMTFNSFGLGIKNNKILFNNVDGNLVVQNSIRANNIQFRYRGQNIKVNGEFKNLPEWLSGRAVIMAAKVDVSFDKLIPEAFFKDSTASDKPDHKRTPVSLPGNLDLYINFKINSLNYKTFSSSKIEGILSYQPKIITFKSLKMESLNGFISGNGFFVQNKDRSVIAKGSFLVTNIDVNGAFRTFHNFGQSFLKAENIKGTLSGSLSLLLPMDSVLDFRIKTLTAEGKYHLVNGALINFDPVKQLSSFIALSELENISFEQLDNDFFIRNNYLYIPQMDVKSSAADLSVNGKHSFDNDYEYHVKILLSEILSKKRIKNRSNVTEFGVVEDDGLGRTSLLLKVIGKGEIAKVGYDMKAAGTEVTKDIKKERQTLKTILNQEYGWYKNDSALNTKEPEKKPRFRITWDDEDTVKSPPDKPVNKSVIRKK
jgi:hypothetical protein